MAVTKVDRKKDQKMQSANASDANDKQKNPIRTSSQKIFCTCAGKERENINDQEKELRGKLI